MVLPTLISLNILIKMLGSETGIEINSANIYLMPLSSRWLVWCQRFLVEMTFEFALSELMGKTEFLFIIFICK